MVCADLQGLFLPHEQPNLPIVLALQQSDLPRASLLPLPRVVVKAVQLALPARACREPGEGTILIPSYTGKPMNELVLLKYCLAII